MKINVVIPDTILANKVRALISEEGYQLTTSDEAEYHVFIGTGDVIETLAKWVDELRQSGDSRTIFICSQGLTHLDRQSLGKDLNTQFVTVPTWTAEAVAGRVLGELFLRENPPVHGGFFCGRSLVFRKALERLIRLGRLDRTVLIRGETGTGKELCSRVLHEIRARGRMETINCATLKPELIESILFGYIKGAFTGANQPKKGLVEAVADGTLFMDEIGELAPDAQATLLRALEQREIRAVGSNQSKEIHARFVMATHRALEDESANFRQDLYQRISPLTVRLPALRERMADLPILVSFLLDRLNETEGHQMERKLTLPTNFDIFYHYDWPGNIRELNGWLLDAYVMQETDEGPLDTSIIADHIEQHRSKDEEEVESTKRHPSSDSFRYIEFYPGQDNWQDLEERARLVFLQDAFERSRGSVAKMVDATGLSRSTLYSDIKRFNLGNDEEMP